MKYYKDIKGNVYAYDSDGSQDDLIGDKVKMTDAEIDAHLNQPPTPEQLEAEAARQKAIAIANIKVTVNGKEFDGHTEARANMGHAIMLAGITSQTSTEWKLADNTFATVTVADLQQALLLSLTKYGEIIGAA